MEAEHQRVLSALSDVTGVPISDLQGCGATVRLDDFDLRLHARDVLLTQRGFLAISAKELASRLGAKIVTADAAHIRLRR